MTRALRLVLVFVLVGVASLAAGAAALLLVGGAGAPRGLAWSGGRWTDGRSVQVEAGRIDPRRVLWESARPVQEGGSHDEEDLPAAAAASVNSRLDEFEPRVVAAGSTMFLVRGRPGAGAERGAAGDGNGSANGGAGGSDVWVARWTQRGWSVPEPMVSINTAADELGPELSADGSRLYFSSDRDGGFGGYDLWMTRRLDAETHGVESERWSEPVNLGPGVNSAFNEYGPALTPDGDRLYFASNRPRADEPESAATADEWHATVREQRTRHDYDLYEATVDDGEPGDARALVQLNTASDEGSPVVSPAGDFLWFASDRSGGHGGLDLYRTRLMDGEPEEAELLDESINSGWNELDPTLGAEGFRLTFSSDRPLDRGGATESSPLLGAGSVQASAGASRRDYNLWTSVSREVWLAPSQGPSLASTLTPMLPWILLLLLLALLLWLLSRLLGNANLRARLARLSLLTQCLLASLLLHSLLALLLAVWHVGTGLQEGFERFLRDPGGTQVALEGSAAATEGLDGIAAQVRGELTSIEVAALAATPDPLEAPEAALEPPDAPPITMAELSPDATRRADLDATHVPIEVRLPQDTATAAPSAPEPVALGHEAELRTPAQAIDSLPAPSAQTRPTLVARSATLPAAPRSSADAAPMNALASATSGAPLSSIEVREPAPATPSASAAEPVSEEATRHPAAPPALEAPRGSLDTPAAPTVLAAIAPASAPTTSAATTRIELPARSPLASGQNQGESPLAAPPPRALPAAAAPAPEPTMPASHAAPAALEAPRLAPSPGPAPITSARVDLAVAGRSGSTATEGAPPPPGHAGLRSTDALATAPPRRIDAPRLPDVPPEVEAPVPLETFAQRDPEARSEVLERMGGSAQTERAVALALEWLARHQARDGRWSAERFDGAPASRDGAAGVPCGCDHAAEVPMDLATTALALLCFLGAGHTQTDAGPYGAIVEGGLAWIVARQRPDGDLRQPLRSDEESDTMYGQTIAAVALCEAYAMTSDVRLADAARRAVRFVIDRTEASRRGRTSPEDTSVLGWQLMVFASARRAGIDVPPRAWSQARTWLESVAVPGARGRYAYSHGGAANVAMTAEAMFVRQLLDELDGRQPDAAVMDQSATFVATVLPRWTDDAPTHHWYYATLALHHHQGEAWRRWNEALAPALVGQQRTEGCLAGSWNPQDRWSTLGGRLYQTAVCTLSLEAYYRYRSALPQSGDVPGPQPKVR